MMKRLALVLPPLLLLSALGACGDDDDGAGTGDTAGTAGVSGTAGASGSGFDCSTLQAMGGGPGPQGGTAGGDNPLACAQASCASECADLIATLGSFGGPGGPGAGGGAGAAGGPSSPGQKLYQERSCASCHGTVGEGTAGPNITSSLTAGIGDWTEAEVRSAIREGKGRGGEELCSSMPRWEASQIDDASLDELVAYLRSLPAIDLPNEGSLCGSGAAGTTGAAGGPAGMPALSVSEACLACLDPRCPDLAGPLRCLAGGQ